MLRKLIAILILAISVAVIANYYGLITLPSLKKSAALDSRDKMLHKTEGTLKDG